MKRPLDRLREAAAQREAAGLRRVLRPRTPDHDGLLDLASNDYLGLSRDARLIEAAARATREWGTGSTGSRLVTGTTRLHADLEERLAAFTGAARALVFSSGYLANLAAVGLAAVAARDGGGSLIVSDAGNHASIVDACRLSRSRVVVTPHGDADAVEKILAERTEEHALVVTDAVFSVDGDLAPLRELHAAAVRHGALLVVDEAHALGVVGERGRGAVHEAGLAESPDIVRTVTLSKSLGSQGGAVLGAPEVIETLIDTGRSFIFDTGLAPGSVGAALAALDILEGTTEGIEEDIGESPADLPGRARANARALAAMIRELGLANGPETAPATGPGAGSVSGPATGSVTGEPAAAVVPVVLGPPQLALSAAALCVNRGIRVGCFRPPSVPQGGSCLRLTARADLGSDDLAVVRGALTAVAELKVDA